MQSGKASNPINTKARRYNRSVYDLPMNIGNYWRINSENCILITDTVRIEENLFKPLVNF